MNELMIQNIAHTIGAMDGTMSSLEIAKLAGKRHDHVMRDITDMIDRMESKGVPKSGDTLLSTYTNGQNGQTYPCWILAKEDSMTLAAGYEPAIRKRIILRWAELEYKEKTGEYSDPVKVAHDRFEYITQKACSVADLLGYSEGHKRKEALEIAIKIEQDSGIAVAPAFLINDPQALNPDQTLSPFHGTHAVMVAVGSKGYSVSNIAHLFGLTSGTVINDILMKEGFQHKICSGKYKPTEKAKLLCNVRTLASGKHKGQDIIIEWLYDSNKVLRDVIEQGIAEIEAKRQQKLKSKTDVNAIDPRLQRYYQDVKSS